MSEFLDVYLPANVPGTPCVSAPRFKTTIQVSAGGGENRNQDWEHPLMRFVLPEAVARQWDVVQSLMKHWRIMRGPFRSFPWRDPQDCASTDLSKPNMRTAALLGLISATDQYIGTGDGFTDRFQLVKTYSYGGETYDRRIHLPVVSSVVVAIDGEVIDPSEYIVTRPGGEIVFNDPPAEPDLDADPPEPRIITAGFLFDCEVRFESDDAMEMILRAHTAAGFADLTLIEVRPC